MTWSFDPERDVSARRCDRCGRDYTLVKGFLFLDHDPRAVYFAACHDHDGEREAWIDVILGSFGDDDSSDHITFGCRVGPVQGQDDPAATLVDAAVPYGDPSLFGQKLSRADGLAHPWLAQYWEAVDFVLVEDPTVHEHVYGPH